MIDSNRSDCCKNLAKGGPITITIAKPEDMLFMAEGILLRISYGNAVWVQSTIRAFGTWIQMAGVEKPIAMFFDEIKKNGMECPEFAKPLIIHILKTLNPAIKD